MWESGFGLWSDTRNHVRGQLCFLQDIFAPLLSVPYVASKSSNNTKSSIATSLKEKPFKTSTQKSSNTQKFKYFPNPVIQSHNERATDHTNTARLIHPAVLSFCPAVDGKWPHLKMSQSEAESPHTCPAGLLVYRILTYSFMCPTLCWWVISLCFSFDWSSWWCNIL